MFISSKKYTKEGRTRFGSAIFIDDINEERVDRLTGMQRDAGALISLIILIILKFLTANYYGIFLTIPVFLIIYFYGVKSFKITYTKHRILMESEYQNPRLIRILSYTLLGIITFIIASWIFSLRSIEGRIDIMAIIFRFFNLYDSRFFLYRNFVRSNFTILNPFDSVVTIAISIWFAVQFLHINFEFTEVNLSHISEQLIRLKTINTLRGILGFIIGFSLVQFLYFTRFSITFLIIAILLFQIVPRRKYIHLSLVGPSNRTILRNLVISSKEFSNISRTTAITYGWKEQRDEKDVEFPENVIPKEVVSIYETGLRSYSNEAFKQANYIGLIISSISNIVVILALIRFSIINQVVVYETIFLISIAMVILSGGFFIAITGLNQIRVETQRDEKLLIGEKFIARYTGNSLWILSGRSTEGTTVQRGRSRQLIRFDKARGMIIEWERFTLIAIFLFFIIIIYIWNSLGAINLQAIPLLFPSLIDLGLEFLEQKATAELEFFIIAGYVLWIVTLIFYPRYYARSRPTLYIDMEYASIEPIVLKDFTEHQNASMEFTKSLISASNRSNRTKFHRPGSFILSIFATSQLGEGSRVKFYVGEAHRVVEKGLPIDQDTLIMDNVIVSGLRGYPEVNVLVELYNDNNDCLFTQSQTIQIIYSKENINELDFGIFGSVELVTVIKKQKA